LTGRYAHNTGVHGNGYPRNLDVTTMFTRLLRNAGYQTAMVGKFLNSWPLTRAPPYFGKWAMVRPSLDPYVNPEFNVNGTVKTVAGYATSIMGTYSVSFLRSFEWHDRKPWLLYVAPLAPHHPWTPEPRYRDVRFPTWHGNPAVFEEDRSDKPAYVRGVDWTIAGGRQVRTGQLRTLMSVDDMVGRIFGNVRALGENRRTLAFFLSDNGYLWADHHFGGDRGTAGQKRVPYTPSVRVPFFLRWPGHVTAGHQAPRLTGTVDIAPTVLDAAEVSPDPSKPPLDGRSLLRRDTRERMLLEYWRGNPSNYVPSWASIRTPSYQYIETYRDDERTVAFREYYNLIRDPWQLHNLLHDWNPDNNPPIRPLHTRLARDRVCRGTGSGLTACP